MSGKLKRCDFCQIPYVKEECGCFLSRFANSYFGKHNIDNIAREILDERKGK